MCHINIIKRKDEYPDSNINYYMDIVSWNSYSSNDDGEGYIAFGSRKYQIDRSIDKILYKNLQKFHTLITHQRYTTSGYGLNNTHPHESKDFVLQHNGVFLGVGDKDNSDTKIYLEFLQKVFDVEKNILKSVKICSESFKGSYSIVLFDKNTEKVYYYKNSSTSMYILEDKNYIVMSTSEKNLKIAKLFFGIKNSIKEVKSDILYELTTYGLKFNSRIKPKSKVKNVNTTIFDYSKDKTINKSNINNSSVKNNYLDDNRNSFEEYWSDKLNSELLDDINESYYINEYGHRVRTR